MPMTKSAAPRVTVRFMVRDNEWRVSCRYCRSENYFPDTDELRTEKEAAFAVWMAAINAQDVNPGRPGFGESPAWPAYEALQKVLYERRILAEKHARADAADHRRWHREECTY